MWRGWRILLRMRAIWPFLPTLYTSVKTQSSPSIIIVRYLYTPKLFHNTHYLHLSTALSSGPLLMRQCGDELFHGRIVRSARLFPRHYGQAHGWHLHNESFGFPIPDHYATNSNSESSILPCPMYRREIRDGDTVGHAAWTRHLWKASSWRTV